MKITEKKLSWFSQLGEQLIEFADTYAKAKYNETGSMYISSFDGNSISFKMEWETGCMGCYDSHSIDFDISFKMLASEDWKEKLQAQIDEARDKRAAEEKAAMIRYEKEKQDREHLEYLRLKEKYERRKD